MGKKFVRLLSLMRKALAILIAKGPVEFTKSVRRGFNDRRYLLGPISDMLHVTLPTLTETLFHQGPVTCWRCAARLSKEKKYGRLCQLKAAEYTDPEIDQWLTQSDTITRLFQEENLS